MRVTAESTDAGPPPCISDLRSACPRQSIFAVYALIIQALTTSILISGLPPEYNLIIKALVDLFVLFLQSDNARQSYRALVSRGTP